MLHLHHHKTSTPPPTLNNSKSHYKEEFAEACVKFLLERSTGCKLVTRRGSVSPEVAKTLDFPLNSVEFLNRSYPVVQAAMGNASVCDIFFGPALPTQCFDQGPVHK